MNDSSPTAGPRSSLDLGRAVGGFLLRRQRDDDRDLAPLVGSDDAVEGIPDQVLPVDVAQPLEAGGDDEADDPVAVADPHLVRRRERPPQGGPQLLGEPYAAFHESCLGSKSRGWPLIM